MKSNNPAPSSVTRHVEMRILLESGRARPMPCTLGFSVESPYAVTATFHSVEGDVSWVFARELLILGVDQPTGEGDIRVKPVRVDNTTWVQLELISPSGQAVLQGTREDVTEFVEASVELLPVGSEWQHLNFDAGLEQLLRDG